MMTRHITKYEKLSVKTIKLTFHSITVVFTDYHLKIVLR